MLDSAVGPYQWASDPNLTSFSQVGDEMVAHRHGIFGAPTVGGTCALTTAYTIDLWVKRAALTSYGTRNYHGDAPVMMCRPLI